MFGHCHSERVCRCGDGGIARRAKKALSPRSRPRRLAAEPLERRELLSVVDPLLHTFRSTPENDSFGASIATASIDDHDYVLIGAPVGDTRGAAYLFDAATPDRQLLATLVNPNPALGGAFGTSVAFAGGNILVAASNAGYLFSPDDTTGQSWHVAQTFLLPSPPSLSRCSVTAVGDNVFVGSSGYDMETASDVGAAYMFDVTTGQLLHTFLSPTPLANAHFGDCVAVVGDDLLIGEPSTTSTLRVGNAYLFDPASGDLLRTLEAPSPVAGDFFGSSLAVSDDGTILVGAPAFSTGGMNAPNSKLKAAYVFDSAGNWQRTIANPTTYDGSCFGYSVAFVGEDALVGAPYDDTAGRNGGAAYLFDGSSGELLRAYLRDPAPAPATYTNFGVRVAGLGDQVLIYGLADTGASPNIDQVVYLFEGVDPQHGDISGKLFADLNENGIDDEGASLMPGFKVFLDGYLPGTAPNGQLDEGEPWTTPFVKSGHFAFYGLEPGTYTVAQMAADNWMPTIASHTVDVVAGRLSGDVQLGAYIPTGVAVYRATGVPVSLSSTSSKHTMTIDDSLTILDLNLSLDITTRNASNTINGSLTAPDDTIVLFGRFQGTNTYNLTFDDEASTILTEAAAPYAGSYRPEAPLYKVDLLNICGTWDLSIGGYSAPKGKQVDTLNAWSITITYPLVPPASRPPTIASLSDSPDPVAPGQTLTLTANGVTDDMGVAYVTFYRENSGLTDTVLGTDTDGSNGWSLAVPIDSSLVWDYVWPYTYYARAIDTDGNLSNRVSTTNLVKVPKGHGKPRVTSTSELAAPALPNLWSDDVRQKIAAPQERPVTWPTSMTMARPRIAQTASAVDRLFRSDRWADDVVHGSIYDEPFTLHARQRAHRGVAIDLAMAEMTALLPRI